MISLSRDDGARADLLVACTHSRRGNIVDLYTEFSWGALCAEIAKLEITREQPQVVELQLAAAAGLGCGVTGSETPVLGTILGTVEDDPKGSQRLEKWRRRESTFAGGFQPAGIVQPWRRAEPQRRSYCALWQ